MVSDVEVASTAVLGRRIATVERSLDGSAQILLGE